ncbi:MAG: Lrp/AsnC family transcriptional regulator [Candidatus Omnitrophota bacterium]
MASAYLKIVIEPGREEVVKAALSKMPQVTSVDLTSGEQDLICLLEGESYEEILNIVVKKIRLIEGVSNTITDLVV